MKEVWRKINGFENYLISNRGRVYSRRRERAKGGIRKFALCSSGYPMVYLYNVGKHHKLIHRLVAKAFIPNPENLPEVNHKNGIKTDNRVSNLEWVTRRGNMIHARDILRTVLGKPVIGIHIKTGERIEFKSIAEAGRNGFDHGDISGCCLKKHLTHKGYIWKYAA